MLVWFVCLFSAATLLTAVTSDDEAKLVKAQGDFSLALFKAITDLKGVSSNVLFAPYSIYHNLLTVYLASAEDTENALEDFLHFKHEDTNHNIKDFITKVILQNGLKTHAREYELTTVDHIFYSPDFVVRPDKVKLFSEKISRFKTRDKREEEINKWVSDHTNGMIKDVLAKGTIKPNKYNSTFVFVNAAHFKGSWEVKLTGRPVTKSFTLSNGDALPDVRFMTTLGYFHTYNDEELNSQVISLPYKGNDITMIIILPISKPEKKSAVPIEEVVDKLTFSKFQVTAKTVLQSGISCRTPVQIPKFETQEKYDLIPVFKKLGQPTLFTDKLNLDNLFEPQNHPQSIYVSNIVHQAKVKVHENGTEAAATTVTHGFGRMPMPKPPTCTGQFVADHPFIFVIYDKTKEFIHYWGLLNNPKQ